MQPEIFLLPSIQFVGGSTEEYRFNLKNALGTQSFNAQGATINFSVTRQGYQRGTPNISKNASLIADTDGIYSIAVVDFDVADTLNLEGKFIYQIIVKDIDGHVESPFYGEMYIVNNNNKSFLS